MPQRRLPRGKHSGRIETERSDEVWATDLTKIATSEGWLWLVGVIDCHDRDLIGHRYGASADTTLCLGALHDAVWERFPDRLDDLKALAPQLSHDWGSQFTSRRYGGELQTLGIMSRPTMIGSPEQNGIMERFFGSLKDEEVWTTEYDTKPTRSRRSTQRRRLERQQTAPKPGRPNRRARSTTTNHPERWIRAQSNDQAPGLRSL